jgi:NAD(P)-dependent dehydrogenase (short-subunit alcohol dehydrogenase family)
MATKNTLKQPVAIVTGASRGIGREIALELARRGHAVVVNYASSAPAAEEVVAAIEADGGQAVAVKASVADSTDRAHLVQAALEHFGRIDVLVNNAGITSPGRADILAATEENWDTVLGTNLKGPFFLTQTVANEMLRLRAAGTIERGTIINISSISAYAVSTNRGDYCVSKAAIEMLTKLFAARLADDGIAVFEIRPGIISTDMTSAVQEKYDRLIADGLLPIKRWGTPADVAAAVAALVGGAFPYSTGDVFNVDGGFHLRRL